MTEQHLHAVPDPHTRLGDPFRPGGELAGNLREHNGWDSPADDELRESMVTAGWLDGHPAIQDEYGATITGHRRLAMAEELGITPKILVIEFGTGDAADIRRLKMAWLSNTGGKPFSKGDRAKMSAYLASRGWTQMSIAEALNVAQSTIARDLSVAIQRADRRSSGGGNCRWQAPERPRRWPPTRHHRHHRAGPPGPGTDRAAAADGNHGPAPAGPGGDRHADLAPVRSGHE